METNMAENVDVRALLNKFNKATDSADASTRWDRAPLQPPSPGPRTWAGPGTPPTGPPNGHLRPKPPPLVPPEPLGAARMPLAGMPLADPRGHPSPPRLQLPPVGGGSSRLPPRSTISPSGGKAPPPGLGVGRARMTEELLQNMMQNRVMTPPPRRAPVPPHPAASRGSVTEVTPLRRPLPPEGPLPMKPRRPPQVNLEPYLRARRPQHCLQKDNGSARMGGQKNLPPFGIRLPPGRPVLAPPPRQPDAKSSNRQDIQDLYDDVETLEMHESRNDGSSQKNGESDDSEVYESINEDEVQVAPALPGPKPHKQQKNQLEMDKKERREQEKRENELRKKFQLKGPLEVLHTARVRRDWQGGKLDLAVRQGEPVEILRVKENPGGKWLVRNQTGKWGYVSIDCVDVDYEEVRRQVSQRLQNPTLPPPPPDPPRPGGSSFDMGSSGHADLMVDDDDDYDDVQLPDEFPPPPECSFDPSVAQELKKKFKFEGPLRVLHTMMVDPNGVIMRPKEKELAIAQGEIVDVLQFRNNKMALCRNHIGKFGFVPRSLLLQMEGDIYDDIDHFNDIYDNDTET